MPTETQVQAVINPRVLKAGYGLNDAVIAIEDVSPIAGGKKILKGVKVKVSAIADHQSGELIAVEFFDGHFPADKFTKCP